MYSQGDFMRLYRKRSFFRIFYNIFGDFRANVYRYLCEEDIYNVDVREHTETIPHHELWQITPEHREWEDLFRK
jgi:hypothetical protein